jgi:vacuolar-type H+-ATPase subunit E/Vma4
VLETTGLLTALTGEVDAELERISADANAEVERILDTSRARAGARRTAALAARDAELRIANGVRVAAARRVAHTAQLEARTRAIDKVLAAARHIVSEMPPAAVAAESVRMLGEAMRFAPDDALVVRCAPEAVAAIRAAVAQRGNVNVEPADIVGPGVIITTADGTLRIEDTLMDRLDRQRIRLAVEIIAKVEASNGRGVG